MSFITENLGTILVVLVLAALLILDVRYLIHKKKAGGCAGCPSAGGCASCSCACSAPKTAAVTKQSKQNAVRTGFAKDRTKK